jgi:signal peptidase I
MANFSLFLVLATFITGIVWLIDIIWLAARRRANAGKRAKDPVWVEYSKAFFPILFVVLILRSFIVEPFKIPSGSMLPTLRIGDFILVNKFTYGLRLPVVNTKFVALGEPVRGDVVVFKYPENPKLDFIKRVVGLPGDHIAYRNKQLHINGEPVLLTEVNAFPGQQSRTGLGFLQEYTEQLGTVSHQILQDPQWPAENYEGTVPTGHYFVMGDNRDDSRDSRAWGFLPEANLVGKAFFIWMHVDIGGDGLDLSRIGGHVR